MRTRHLFVYLLLFVFILSACSVQPAPVPPSESKGPAPVLAAPKPSNPVETEVLPPPTAGSTAEVITPANLTRLQAQVLPVPEYVERLLWPKSGTPGIPANARAAAVRR
jgi:hypothetical protein